MSSRDSRQKPASSSRGLGSSSSSSSSSSSKPNKSRAANQSVTKQHAAKAAPAAGVAQNKQNNSSHYERRVPDEPGPKPTNSKEFATKNGGRKGASKSREGESFANLDCNVVVLKPTSFRSVKNKKKSQDKFLADMDNDQVDSNEMATTQNPTSKTTTTTTTTTIASLEEETDLDGEENSLLSTNSSTSTVKLSPKRGSSSLRRGNDETLAAGWEQHMDKSGPYFWHVSTGVIQRNRPSSELSPSKDSILVYHDDEEINVNTGKRPSLDASGDQLTELDEDEFFELSSGAALTVADDNTTLAEEIAFVVYPLGCCDFDETQLVSSTSTKAIQKCILKLSNRPLISEDEVVCWGLTQSQPVLLKLVENQIQFTDIESKTLLRSQPIPTIKTWAVDDNNNFAFVVEDRPDQVSSGLFETDRDTDYMDSVDYALLSEPTLICYVFHSIDDDDMSCKVASKLTEEISRYKEQLSNRISKSTRLQQMRVEQQPLKRNLIGSSRRDSTDIDESDFDSNLEDELANNDHGDDDDELEANNELTMKVKYIGKTPVPRPSGIEVLNVAIDWCLAEASKAQINRSLERARAEGQEEGVGGSELGEPLTEAKLHVSPSSVIVENTSTGEIIVECRIRFLTFMGISRRDIRWCGFIMQNPTNKSFVAHCFECHPTAGHVCEAIQLSCSRMYEKIMKNSQSSHRNRRPEAISLIPGGSVIRNTLAKTFSRIKLNPLVSNSLH